MAQEIKSKALDLALSQIEKQFGKGSIMKLGEQAIVADIAVIPTGSLGLDLALGVGGLPRGSVIEIYGPESSGKTTLALECIAEAQKLGGIGAFIDAEHALDAGYARKLGVSVEDLLISQRDNGEQALEIAETLVQSEALRGYGRLPSVGRDRALHSGYGARPGHVQPECDRTGSLHGLARTEPTGAHVQ